MSEPESRFFESARLRLHYTVWGDESKPTLVLVHGGRDHGRSWDFVAHAMVDRYCVYAPDLRGHGDSDWAVGGAYRLSDYVVDLAKLIEVLDRGPVNLVGHSLGGRIVLDYAGVFPDNVTRLASIEGIGWRFTSQMEASARLRRYADGSRDIEKREPRTYPTVEDAMERMHEANKRLTPAMVRHLTEHAVRRNEDGTYAWKFDNYIHLRSIPEWSIEDTKNIWRGIKAPLLLIDGAESELRMPDRDELAPVLNARSVTFQNAAHWVHHDQLEGFVAAIREFFAE